MFDWLFKAHSYFYNWFLPAPPGWYFEDPSFQPPWVRQVKHQLILNSVLKTSFARSGKNLCWILLKNTSFAWSFSSSLQPDSINRFLMFNFCQKETVKLPSTTWDAPSTSPSPRSPPVSAQLLSLQRDPWQSKVWKVTKCIVAQGLVE